MLHFDMLSISELFIYSFQLCFSVPLSSLSVPQIVHAYLLQKTTQQSIRNLSITQKGLITLEIDLLALMFLSFNIEYYMAGRKF